MNKKTLIHITFALSILLMLFVSNSWKVFNYPPKSVHQWRQSDCAAYVKTYYRTGSGLLQPATYNLAGKQGRVISEFPVIYYISAKIQHLTGEHYWVLRSLTFLCFISGLLALLRISMRWIQHPVLVMFPVILLLTSPYYYYYAINFLPNIPAISFSFIGLYFFLKYKDTQQWVSLVWGTLFFILSTALKPTDGGILWLAFVAAILCTRLTKKQVEYKKPILVPIIIASLIIGSSILLWAKYVNWYNDENGNHQNLIGIHPIWNMDKSLIRYTYERIRDEWIDAYQQRRTLYIIILTLPFFIWKWKHFDSFLKWLTVWTILGTVAYSLLWFKAYTDHDYYQLPILLPFVFMSITMLAYFDKYFLKTIPKVTRWISLVVVILLMGIGVYHNRNIQNERYTKPEYVYINPALYEIEPYLKTLGIKPTDAIVCVPDKSPNMSLNAINHYGYTEEFNSKYYNIDTFVAHGASYLIISNSKYLTKPLYQRFTKKKIGEYKGIYVFDIRKIH